MRTWIIKCLILVLLSGLVGFLRVDHLAAHHANLEFMGGADIEIGTVVKRRFTIDTRDAPGSYRAIRVYNFGDRIDINKVIVKYSDGTEHVEDRSFFLREGERTREVDPRSQDKFVDEVEIFYKRRPFSGRAAQIQIRGRQSRNGRFAVRSGSRRTTQTARAPEPKPEPVAAPKPKPEPEPEYVPPENKVVIETSTAPKDGRCGGPRSMLIATGRVDFGEDRDVLKVGRPEMGKFSKVRLCVKRADIELLDLKVNFKDGEAVKLPFAGIIQDGYRTDTMDLEGKHFVETIDIAYKRRQNFSRRATVEVWGELSTNWLDEEGEKFNDGWVQLTAGDTAGFIGFEVDNAEVPTHLRGFKEIRVVTRNRDITLDYVQVSFADGSAQKYEANRTKVEPTAPYGPLIIQDGPKVITGVESRYRSRFFDREASSQERATVEIQGRR